MPTKSRLALPDVVVSFNAEVGRGGPAMIKSVRGILEDHPSTDALLFQEAGGYVDDLRKAFGERWHIYAKSGWPESDNCPVMTRRQPGFPGRKYGGGWGTVRCHKGWVGPKAGLRHPGRTWTWVKVGKVYVLSLHRVWGGEQDFKGNGEAYLEEAKELTAWISRHQPCLVFGDTNTGYHETHPGSMRNIRARVKGKLVADEDNPGIDYALLKGVNAKVHRTVPYGSDHRAAVMNGIKLPERKRS